MESLKNDEVMINLELFKRYGIYQLFDPKSPKIFNYNAYRFFYITYLIVVLCINVLTITTLIMEGNIDYTAFTLLLFVYNACILCIINIGLFVYKADTIWRLIDVTRFDFLKSRACCKHINIVYEYHKISTKITDYINRSFIMAYLIWVFYPLVFNVFMTSENQNQCYDNIFNMKFPVSASIYNQYYYVFYVTEVVLLTFHSVSTTVVILFLISLYFTLIAQYEVLTCAYKDIGHEDYPETLLHKKENDVIDELKQTLCDHSNVYIKLKIFFSVIWTIIVTHVILNSMATIVLVYSAIVIYMSADLLDIINILKLIVAFIVLCADLFLCCYLCDILNDKVEAVNFGLYSCNWTDMGLKFKKLILLAMRMNNATRLNIRLSPIKLVNLQLLTNVIKIAYNVINVMLNTFNKTNQ